IKICGRQQVQEVLWFGVYAIDFLNNQLYLALVRLRLGTEPHKPIDRQRVKLFFSNAPHAAGQSACAVGDQTFEKRLAIASLAKLSVVNRKNTLDKLVGL